jgi:hypothetical protein
MRLPRRFAAATVLAPAIFLLLLGACGPAPTKPGTDVVTQATGGGSPDDDAAIRALLAAMKTSIEAHDVDGFMALVAADYLHNRTDRAAFQSAVQNDLAHVQTFAYTISSIVVNGSTASVLASFTMTLDDQASSTWTEPSSGEGSFGAGWLVKQDGAWLIRGNQVRSEARVAVAYNPDNTPPDDRYFRMEVVTSTPVTSITVTGPGIPASPFVYRPEFDSWTCFVTPSAFPVIGTPYVFHVVYAGYPAEDLTALVTAVVSVPMTMTLTPTDGTLQIGWLDIAAQVTDASHYVVTVTDVASAASWRLSDLALSRTSAVFDEDGKATFTLQSGRLYEASVSLFDSHGNYTYRIGDITMP